MTQCIKKKEEELNVSFLYCWNRKQRQWRERETLVTIKEEYQIQCPKYSRYTTKCIAIIQHHSE